MWKRWIFEEYILRRLRDLSKCSMCEAGGKFFVTAAFIETCLLNENACVRVTDLEHYFQYLLTHARLQSLIVIFIKDTGCCLCLVSVMNSRRPPTFCPPSSRLCYAYHQYSMKMKNKCFSILVIRQYIFLLPILILSIPTSNNTRSPNNLLNHSPHVHQLLHHTHTQHLFRLPHP